MTIADKKKDLRELMLKKRGFLNNINKKEYDYLICESLWLKIIQNNYQVVHSYLPLGSEIDITHLIKKMLKAKITVVTPKTLSNRRLKNIVLKSMSNLEVGIFGTRYPKSGVEYNNEYDLIIVPGLAFDHMNFRLGYGGAYYDTFLVHQINAYKIGICYPFQRLETIPLEPHDIQLDELLCF